jgi:hypothetical protein
MFRADPIVTLTYLVTLAAPAVVYASIRFARAGNHDAHRIVQAVCVVLAWIAVLALELRIRLAGGSGAFLAMAPPELHAWAQRLLVVHVAIAIATYLVWTWLVVASWRRFRLRLPGSFSRRHRTLGMLVLAGLVFTAASATGMFVLAFVA